MSGGSKTQNTTTTNEPLASAKPLLDTAMGDAMKLYNKGNLVPSNNMSTVVPWSSQSTAGMNAIEQNARSAMANNPMGNVMGQMGNIWGNGGFNSQQQTALDALNPIARGDYLNRTDQNFENVLSRTKENAGTDVNSMMAGMGRFAGGANQGILADTLGGIESKARLDQYNLERDRQTNAANQIFGMGQVGQQNLAGAGDAWSSLLAGRDAPANALLGVGAMHEDLAGRKLNDKLRMADGKVNDLRTLLGIASGAGGYGTQRAQMPTQSNGLSNGIGAGLGGLSMLQMLGAFG